MAVLGRMYTDIHPMLVSLTGYIFANYELLYSISEYIWKTWYSLIVQKWSEALSYQLYEVNRWLVCVIRWMRMLSVPG